MCANEINYHQYGITKAQWDSCPDKVKNFIKNNPEQFANLQKTYTTEQIINSLCGKGTKVEQRKGTSVETLDKLEEFKLFKFVQSFNRSTFSLLYFCTFTT